MTALLSPAFSCGNKASSGCRNFYFSSNDCALPSTWMLLQGLSHAKDKTAHSHGCVTSVFYTAIMSLILVFRSALLLKLHCLFPMKYPELSRIFHKSLWLLSNVDHSLCLVSRVLKKLRRSSLNQHFQRRRSRDHLSPTIIR